MKPNAKFFNKKQMVFQELSIGILIYMAVLGFYNDYTTVVDAKSFSTIMLASIVLEIMTFATFLLKNKILKRLKRHSHLFYKILRFFTVWFIMFVSKFIFVWAINWLFGEYISINGFFGILLVVVSVTIMHRLGYLIFHYLGR